MYGNDQYGTSYPNLDAMWQAELKSKGKIKVNNPIGSKKRWYELGGTYWDSKPADYNGVMGGFANLNDVDINFSKRFMAELSKSLPKLNYNEVLDCGAGIGRISKELLSNLFRTIDVVDQCQNYINKAKEILKEKNVRKYYCKGLQHFEFEHRYDCVWLQWVLTYLNDEDSIAFLMKAKANLKQGGVIVVKENASEKGFFVDKLDCSVIRSNLLWKKLFAEAGLRVVKEEKQQDWPQDMFDIRMYALV